MSDALVDAETLLAQLPDAVTRRRLGERLSQAAVTLRNSERLIARIAAVLAVAPLVEFGKTPEQNDAIEEVKDHASAVGKALEEADDAESLRAAVHDYENSLSKSLASLERLIQERWRAFASEKFQRVIGIGELLTSMNIPNNLGGRLVACARKGLATTGSIIELLPAAKSLLAEFEALQVERAAAIGDDEVGAFINALAEKRARLAMVTPKVYEWIKEHNALDRLGVVMR
jgi:hypothetical protein